MSNPKEFPAPDELADTEDQLSWDHERDGRMADFADADDAVETAHYVPGQDN